MDLHLELLIRDQEALEQIHQLLNGNEWTCDTLSDIAEVLRKTDRYITDI